MTTLLAESRKAAAQRSTAAGLAVLLVFSVGVGVLMTLVGDRDALTDGTHSVIFYSSGVTTWVFAYLAASFTAAEFGGLGQFTFVATPARPRVLTAKLLLIAGGGLAAGLLVSVSTVAATQGVLAARGFTPLDLTDPGLIRAVLLLTGCSMAVHGVLAACVAVLVRGAAAAVGLTGVVTLLPVGLAPALGDAFAAQVPRWLPGAAVESLAGVAAPGSYGYLPWPAAAGCLLAWLTLTILAAALRVRRMDLR